MQVFLKIKIKSLAAEALLIRKEATRYEKRFLIRTTTDRLTGKPHEKWKIVKDDSTRLALHHHRRFVVRPEARYSLLAYAYMRGRSALSVDRGVWKQKGNAQVPQVNWDAIKAMVKRFGGDTSGFDAWTKGEAPAAKAA